MQSCSPAQTELASVGLLTVKVRVAQGDKCLADICRPVALRQDDGSLNVLQPLSDADKSCCLMTVQSDDDGEQQCQLLQVCEDKEPAEVRSAACTPALLTLWLALSYASYSVLMRRG